MHEIDIDSFAVAHAADAYVIDVRFDWEYVDGHVPGARLIPLPQLASLVSGLPRTRPVYVICASGNRSMAATGLLHRAGIQALSVAGGTGAWTRSGRPVVTGRRER
jgi:rhodanese-related sulfurtransferase